MATYYSNWSKSHEAGSPSVRLKVVTSYSQSKANNNSVVTIKEYVESKGSDGDYPAWTQKHKLTHTGTTYTDSGDEYFYKTETRLIQTRSKTISHNINGEGSFSFSASMYYRTLNGEGNPYGEGTLSIGTKYITLPTIDRSSTITTNATTNAGKLFGDTITFTISRKSSNYTHKLTYKSGGTTYTIGTDLGTSKTYTFSKDLIPNYPNAVKNGITVTCTTYNGTKNLGSNTCVVYLSVPEEYMPTCSLAIEDIGNIPEGWNIWVKSKSILKGTITASGVEGSTIKSYLAKANDETFNVTPFTTGLLKNNGERVVTASATDTRGRTASASQSLVVVDYVPPTISMCKIERCNADGTLNTDGTYGKATIEFKISPVNNLNAKSVKVAYGSIEKTATLTEYEGSYTFEEVFENLETNATYNFEFSVIDSFEEIPQAYTLPPSFVTMSKLAGGKGVTFGQVATEEGLISHMNTKLYKDVWLKNESIDGLKTEKVNGGWITYAEDEA